jgi:hypothetical protein
LRLYMYQARKTHGKSYFSKHAGTLHKLGGVRFDRTESMDIKRREWKRVISGGGA